jgi:serine/threonine-protein kinase
MVAAACLVAACGEDAPYAGGCVGGCDSPGGRGLFGPASPEDWTSFRNGPARTGVATGAVLGDDVRVVWRRPEFLKLAYSAVKPSAAVWGDGLYIPSDEGTQWAFDRHTGDVRWSVKLSDAANGIHGSPAVSKAVVWIGTYSGNVHALDRTSGEEVYRFFPGRWIGSSPIYVPAHEAVYVSHETSADGLPGAGLVTKNDPRTGRALWTSDRLDHYPHSSVAVDTDGQRVFVGANDGIFRAYDADTGELLWAHDLEPGDEPDPPTADIKTTPAVSAALGLVVFGTWDRHVYALNVDDGTVAWSVDTGGRLMGSAALHEGTERVYVGTNARRDALLAIDLRTGAVAWRFDAGAGIQSSPAVDDRGEGVVVGASDGRLWGLDAATGVPRWSFAADGPLTASPAWVGRNIYIAAKEGSLYALETVED